jgi:hypothetical protein
MPIIRSILDQKLTAGLGVDEGLKGDAAEKFVLGFVWLLYCGQRLGRRGTARPICGILGSLGQSPSQHSLGAKAATRGELGMRGTGTCPFGWFFSFWPHKPRGAAVASTFVAHLAEGIHIQKGTVVQESSWKFFLFVVSDDHPEVCFGIYWFCLFVRVLQTIILFKASAIRASFLPVCASSLCFHALQTIILFSIRAIR